MCKHPIVTSRNDYTVVVLFFTYVGEAIRVPKIRKHGFGASLRDRRLDAGRAWCSRNCRTDRVSYYRSHAGGPDIDAGGDTHLDRDDPPLFVRDSPISSDG